ncbi:hypothetical protein [Candidatus Cetobacterium colombiensis]|uniref:Uncharacterized protein n=1 Tax=Candidatus Cetobacterium colombiensis TaxID=3073100 RepID=A0ABU4WD76_9FUSO|nr:hypothetical protein [Candidatus Cetobacterium colombiensis]MDX8337485.1 hypothetical protein [Candidatus Cetobacterium colombiensis]
MINKKTYSEKFFLKIEEYNEHFKDGFPLMLLPDLEEKVVIEKIDECLLTNKKIQNIVNWFDTFDNPNILG